MASINNLAATGDIFVKVGEVYGNSGGLGGTLDSDSTDKVSVGSALFHPVAENVAFLKGYSIRFSDGRVKIITQVDDNQTVSVKPNFSVPSGTTFKIHKTIFSIDEAESEVNFHSISTAVNLPASEDAVSKEYVDSTMYGGRFSVYNYLHVFEPDDAVADTNGKQFTIVHKDPSDPNAAYVPIELDIASALITVGGSIKEPYADYTFEEIAGGGGTKVVFGSAPNANVVIRGTMGQSEMINEGSEAIITASVDGQTEFQLPFAIYDKPSTLVSVDGVVQTSEHYTLDRQDSKLDRLRFEAPGLLANSVVRVVNMKGAAFIGNFETSVSITDDSTIAGFTAGADADSPHVYTINSQQLSSRRVFNIYVATSQDTIISLPELSAGTFGSGHDMMRIKVTKKMTNGKLEIKSSPGNFFHYEGLDMTADPINLNTTTQGVAEHSETNVAARLDFEWESAYNTWVINQGFGLWTVNSV
jgi:hypothetical protein